MRLFNEAGVPATPVNNLREVLADPQADARGLVWEQAHPKLGSVPLAANALQHMSRTPARPSSHPPLLGEHSRSLLAGELGLGEDENRRAGGGRRDQDRRRALNRSRSRWRR